MRIVWCFLGSLSSEVFVTAADQVSRENSKNELNSQSTLLDVTEVSKLKNKKFR